MQRKSSPVTATVSPVRLLRRELNGQQVAFSGNAAEA
jgi:hypothetical protein